MSPLLWMILLFCAGVALIVAEFFIPGAIAGIVGGLCLLGGAVYGIIAYPAYGFIIGFIYILGSIFAVVGGVFTRAGCPTSPAKTSSAKRAKYFRVCGPQAILW